MISLILNFQLVAAQNNTNGTTSPNATTNTTTSPPSVATIVACMNCANKSSLESDIKTALGTSATAATVSAACGGACIGGRQSWQSTVVTITGATTAELQALQTAIQAGTVPGVPKTAVVNQGGQPISPGTACPTTKTVNQCLSTADCLMYLSKVAWPSATCCNSVASAGTTPNSTVLKCASRQGNQSAFQTATTLEQACLQLARAAIFPSWCVGTGSKKGLLGLLGLLGLIPLLLCLLLLCLCCLRRRKRQQAIKFGEVPGPEIPMAAPPPIVAPQAAYPVPVGVPQPCVGVPQGCGGMAV